MREIERVFARVGKIRVTRDPSTYKGTATESDVIYVKESTIKYVTMTTDDKVKIVFDGFAMTLTETLAQYRDIVKAMTVEKYRWHNT